MYVAILISAAFFGGALLIVVFAYQSIEEQRRREEESAAGAAAVATNGADAGFFGPAPASNGRSRQVEALIVEIDRFLRGEQLLAERFLRQPSTINLHTRMHRPSWSPCERESAFAESIQDPDDVLQAVERRFRRERVCAERFFDEPSLVNLHARSSALASTN